MMTSEKLLTLIPCSSKISYEAIQRNYVISHQKELQCFKITACRGNTARLSLVP